MTAPATLRSIAADADKLDHRLRLERDSADPTCRGTVREAQRLVERASRMLGAAARVLTVAECNHPAKSVFLKPGGIDIECGDCGKTARAPMPFKPELPR